MSHALLGPAFFAKYPCTFACAAPVLAPAGRFSRRSFVETYWGINANVQTEPPVGILLAA